MPHRRHFLRNAGLSAAGIFGSLLSPAWGRGLQRALRDAEGVAPADLATEEEFWYYIQQAFT
ncbi:MAG: aminotransferase, partial [Chitinophagaceae bacterium]